MSQLKPTEEFLKAMTTDPKKYVKNGKLMFNSMSLQNGANGAVVTFYKDMVPVCTARIQPINLNGGEVFSIHSIEGYMDAFITN